MSAEAIAGIAELTDELECLFLNACYSDSIAMSALSHVNVVIGCNASIDDEAAIVFTKSFYRALAHGHGYEKAFRLAQNELQFAGMAAEAKNYKIHLR